MKKARPLTDSETRRVVHFVRRMDARLALENHIAATGGPAVTYYIERVGAKDWVIQGRPV